jgi:hypothetical protein
MDGGIDATIYSVLTPARMTIFPAFAITAYWRSLFWIFGGYADYGFMKVREEASLG